MRKYTILSFLFIIFAGYAFWEGKNPHMSEAYTKYYIERSISLDKFIGMNGFSVSDFHWAQYILTQKPLFIVIPDMTRFFKELDNNPFYTKRVLSNLYVESHTMDDHQKFPGMFVYKKRSP